MKFEWLTNLGLITILVHISHFVDLFILIFSTSVIYSQLVLSILNLSYIFST